MTYYTFSYRRLGFFSFWKKIYFCKGHQHDAKTDTMTVFLKGGGLKTIRFWKECELYLDSAFGDFVKEEAEKSGAKIK